MPKKTYIPGAVSFAKRLDKYLNRYEETILVGATADQIAAFADLVACLAVFLSKWFAPPPVN